MLDYGHTNLYKNYDTLWIHMNTILNKLIQMDHISQRQYTQMKYSVTS